MSEPFLGEIQMFAGTFAPQGWAFCDGGLLTVSQNDALFSLFGTIYGGDGRTTFGLPDLRGRFPMHQGQGAGLSNRRIGQKGGLQSVVLTAGQVGAHTHSRPIAGAAATTQLPGGQSPAVPASGIPQYGPSDGSVMDETFVAGANQSHPNMSPFQVVNFIVALVGIYPSRA